MAVLSKFRSRWRTTRPEAIEERERPNIVLVSSPLNANYELRGLTVAQLEDCWRLDQRCFLDGEAYSRETFEYLLTAPESVSYRIVSQNNAMAGFVIGLVEPDHTGHITTIGIAPEHRRRHLASRLMEKTEEGFRQRDVRIVRLEVRSANIAAQNLYLSLGYSATQRLPRYYSNGGDGLLMSKFFLIQLILV